MNFSDHFLSTVTEGGHGIFGSRYSLGKLCPSIDFILLVFYKYITINIGTVDTIHLFTRGSVHQIRTLGGWGGRSLSLNCERV